MRRLRRSSLVWPLAVCALVAACGSRNPESAETRPREVSPFPGKAEVRPDEQRKRVSYTASVRSCLRAAPGVLDIAVRGPDSEDAQFFADYVSGRVEILVLDLSGQGLGQAVYLFESSDDAENAAPRIGGEGLVSQIFGRAVFTTTSDTAPQVIKRCVRQAGNAAPDEPPVDCGTGPSSGRIGVVPTSVRNISCIKAERELKTTDVRTEGAQVVDVTVRGWRCEVVSVPDVRCTRGRQAMRFAILD